MLFFIYCSAVLLLVAVVFLFLCDVLIIASLLDLLLFLNICVYELSMCLFYLALNFLFELLFLCLMVIIFFIIYCLFTSISVCCVAFSDFFGSSFFLFSLSFPLFLLPLSSPL